MGSNAKIPDIKYISLSHSWIKKWKVGYGRVNGRIPVNSGLYTLTKGP